MSAFVKRSRFDGLNIALGTVVLIQTKCSPIVIGRFILFQLSVCSNKLSGANSYGSQPFPIIESPIEIFSWSLIANFRSKKLMVSKLTSIFIVVFEFQLD